MRLPHKVLNARTAREDEFTIEMIKYGRLVLALLWELMGPSRLTRIINRDPKLLTGRMQARSKKIQNSQN